MNKFLLCNDAGEDHGKSAVLLCLIRLLEAEGYEKLDAFPHTEEEAKEYKLDRTVVFSFNGRQVVIISQGDPHTPAYKDIMTYLNKGNEPVLIICAARPETEKDSPFAEAKEIAREYGYTFVRYNNLYCDEKEVDTATRDQLNRISAEGLKNAIYSLLNL